MFGVAFSLSLLRAHRRSNAKQAVIKAAKDVHSLRAVTCYSKSFPARNSIVTQMVRDLHFPLRERRRSSERDKGQQYMRTLREGTRGAAVPNEERAMGPTHTCHKWASDHFHANKRRQSTGQPLCGLIAAGAAERENPALPCRTARERGRRTRRCVQQKRRRCLHPHEKRVHALTWATRRFAAVHQLGRLHVGKYRHFFFFPLVPCAQSFPDSTVIERVVQNKYGSCDAITGRTESRQRTVLKQR